MRNHLSRLPKVGSRNQAFSLIELMVAMAITLLVSASVFVLFSQQRASANQQQGLVGLNIGIRNAMSQLQLDLANAGTGYYVGADVPSSPVGVTIVNNVPPAGSSCYTPPTVNAPYGTYGTNCFDRLNVLTAANSVTPPYPINATGPQGCSDTSTGTAYGQAATNPDGTKLSLTATAANYSQGNQLLFLNGKGSKMSAVILTQTPTVVGSTVMFTFNATNTDGTNTGANWRTNDPLDIAACDGGPCPTPNNFGNQFCGGDWILKLSPISYYVDSSNPNDPELIRNQGSNTVVVMDQVIGFKVGATIYNSINDQLKTEYNYDASTYNLNNVSPPPYDSAYMFSLVRSVRVSLIGRTKPSTDPSFTFRNPFDGGPYQVQGASVVVDPRNLSMND
jgi:prepilin-type N-terminal cleavage/methylation domain-containing protein